MNGKPFAGKTALVTGGGKGIGRETARVLGNAGFRIFICGRNAADLEATAAALRSEGIETGFIQTDVRDPEACRLLIERIRQEAGRLDAVVNNAGMSMRGTVEETEPEVVRAMMEINYLGTAYVTKYAIPLLKESRGSVVYISSLSALHGLPFVAPYGASKLALRGLAESLRAELYPYGVHVGLVHVGFTENDPGKVVYGRDGSLSPLKRDKNSSTQRQVAEWLYSCIRRRKSEMTLTGIGHLAAFAYRYFPRLSDAVISRFAGKSGMYK